ncbi:MAG: Rrf2 family transcriptional regulator [Ectobacillus sp.]
MRLTSYTDHALRVLMYLGVHHYKLSSIEQISKTYDISKNNLKKIVNHLSKIGMVETIQGRNGGIRLAKKPEDICIGTVVQEMEEDFSLVECFRPEHNTCNIAGSCRLKGILNGALQAYFDELKKYSLADLIGGVVFSVMGEQQK